MRLFIAFEIPEYVSKILADTQSFLSVPGKAILTKSFHLTLKFLGEVENAQLQELKNVLSRIRFAPFTTRLAGIGVFPNSKDPKVVWVGLEPHDTIKNIHKQVDSACQKVGFDPDTRFHPHLTLARIKFLKDNKGFQQQLENLKVPEAEFQLSEFHLIQSTLTPEGPRYEIISTFKTS